MTIESIMGDPSGAKPSKYTAKKADSRGIIHYSAEEHQIWHELITRQVKLIQNSACTEFLHGLDYLNMSFDRIPQPDEISQKLKKATGWEVATVPALISYESFFALLAAKRFPAASFIRSRQEMDYLQEPDIFHEYFGHCPLLTNEYFASFTEKYGQIAAKAGEKYHAKLARLYWFTIEFGLLATPDGLRCYGGGILSSKEETIYALSDPRVEYQPLDFLTALRTPYRIDILQPIYFVIESFAKLDEALAVDLLALIDESKRLGPFPAKFPPKESET